MNAIGALRQHISALLTIAILFIAALTLQFMSDARGHELAHWADEPAHVVTAVMVHDYLSAGLPEAPQRYAERYYSHYPKIALGIWPPLLYLVAGVWMLFFGVSPAALLLLSCTLVASLASLLALSVRRLWGSAMGIVAGLFFLALPSVQTSNSTFMLDIPVALASFAAMLIMERYFRSPSTWLAVALGVTISAAMLTKGNANALVLMVGLMLLITGRFSLLRQSSLYICGLIVIVLGLPWQFITLRLLSRGSNVVPLSLDLIAKKTLLYMRILVGDLTYPVILLIVIGVAVSLWHARSDSGKEVLLLASASSLLLAIVVFHCLVPVVGGVDPRYMTSAWAPGIILFLSGCRYVSRLGLKNERYFAVRLATIVGGCILFAVSLGALRLNAKDVPLGFSQVASVTLSENRSCCNMLISSDSIGEGAFTSEVLFRDRAVSRVVLRATKLVSESAWNGQSFRLLVQDGKAAARMLSDNAVDVVVVDLTKTEAEVARSVLLAGLALEADQWQATRVSGDYNRSFDVYRRLETGHLKKAVVRVPMRFTLGHEIQVHPK